MKNKYEKLFKELENFSNDIIDLSDDVVMFEDIKIKDYFENKLLREESEGLVGLNIEFCYDNSKVYDIILVKNKSVYGNKNMDKLFKEELINFIGNKEKVLFSEFYNNFNNRSLFGMLYNFRSKWKVNSWDDRFENWCKRSGMLVKEEINNKNYKRRYLVNLNKKEM